MKVRTGVYWAEEDYLQLHNTTTPGPGLQGTGVGVEGDIVQLQQMRCGQHPADGPSVAHPPSHDTHHTSHRHTVTRHDSR